MAIIDPIALKRLWWQLKLKEASSPASIIWLGKRFENPGQGPRGRWTPAAVFPSCQVACHVLSQIFNQSSSSITSKHVLAQVQGRKYEERASDCSIMAIVPLGPDERPTIYFVPQSMHTLSSLFDSGFAHPFGPMYAYFVHTGGYINYAASNVASNSNSEDNGAADRAFFYQGVEVAASLCKLDYPPSDPSNRELAAAAASLRSPGVLQAFGIGPSSTSGTSNAGPESASPSQHSASASGQPKDDSAYTYDSDCVLVGEDSPGDSSRGHVDPRGTEAVDEDYEYARKLQASFERSGDSRGAKAVDEDYEYASKLQAEESESGGDSRGAEAVDDDYEYARKLQAEESESSGGSRGASSAKAFDQDYEHAGLFELINTLSDEAEAKAGQPPFMAVVTPTPPKKRPPPKKKPAAVKPGALEDANARRRALCSSFDCLANEFKDIKVPPKCPNREVAANFRTGQLCATAAIQRKLIKFRPATVEAYCGVIFGKYSKYTRVYRDVVESKVQVDLTNYKSFTKDKDILHLLEGAIRGCGSNIYASAMALMNIGQISAPK